MTAAFTIYALIGCFALGMALGAAVNDPDYQFRDWPWWLWLLAVPGMILMWPLAVWRGLRQGLR